jgi:hypothetical protein
MASVFLIKMFSCGFPDAFKIRDAFCPCREHLIKVDRDLPVLGNCYNVLPFSARLLPLPIMVSDGFFRLMQPRGKLLIVVPDQADGFSLLRFPSIDLEYRYVPVSADLKDPCILPVPDSDSGTGTLFPRLVSDRYDLQAPAVFFLFGMRFCCFKQQLLKVFPVPGHKFSGLLPAQFFTIQSDHSVMDDCVHRTFPV